MSTLVAGLAWLFRKKMTSWSLQLRGTRRVSRIALAMSVRYCSTDTPPASSDRLLIRFTPAVLSGLRRNTSRISSEVMGCSMGLHTGTCLIFSW